MLLLLRCWVSCILLLILVACTAARSPASLSPEDPANPLAAEAPVAPLPSLLAGMEPAAPTTQPADDHSQHMPDSHGHHQPAKPAAAQPESEALTATQYVCPMHPDVKQPKAGNCPICGMELKPTPQPLPEKNR